MRLLNVVELTPYFGFLVGTAIVALVAQAVLLEIARRRRERLMRMKRAATAGDWVAVAATPIPTPTAELFGLAALLLVPLVTILSVLRAREMVARSVVEPLLPGPERAALLWAGLNGQLHAMRLGIVLEELIGALGVLALSLAFTARLYTGGVAAAGRLAPHDPVAARAWLRFPGPDTETVFACACAVSALAFLPLLQGVVSYCALLLERLAPLAGAPPAEITARVRQVDTILLDARHAMEAGTTASWVGLGLAIATCAVLLWWRSPTRARRRWLGRPAPVPMPDTRQPAMGPWIAGACALLAAAALWTVAERLRSSGNVTSELDGPAVTPAAPADRRA